MFAENARSHAGSCGTPPTTTTQFVVRGSVPKESLVTRPQFAAFPVRSMEPVEAKSVFYSGTSPTGKLPPSIRFPHTDQPEIFR
jgi:hypothetical protein